MAKQKLDHIYGNPPVQQGGGGNVDLGPLTQRVNTLETNAALKNAVNTFANQNVFTNHSKAIVIKGDNERKLIVSTNNNTEIMQIGKNTGSNDGIIKATTNSLTLQANHHLVMEPGNGYEAQIKKPLNLVRNEIRNARRIKLIGGAANENNYMIEMENSAPNWTAGILFKQNTQEHTFIGSLINQQNDLTIKNSTGNIEIIPTKNIIFRMPAGPYRFELPKAGPKGVVGMAMVSNRIAEVGAPQDGGDAANKDYVDAIKNKIKEIAASATDFNDFKNKINQWN